jgi:protein-S-isoprenylcysteine O-methyltransferase Ste14
VCTARYNPFVRNLLETSGWIVCMVYATIPSFWLVIHPRAEHWRSRARSPYRLLLPMWMGMWVVCGLASSPWRHLRLHPTWWSSIPAAIVFAIGLWIYRRSGAGFSARQLGGLPEILDGHQEQRLVTSGIRSRVRHPIYLGHLCEMLAWSLGTGLAVCYALTALAVLTGALMIRLEDAELGQRFGREYREYRRRVPAILPFLGRASIIRSS